jgi:hypothetical protein
MQRKTRRKVASRRSRGHSALGPPGGPISKHALILERAPRTPERVRVARRACRIRLAASAPPPATKIIPGMRDIGSYRAPSGVSSCRFSYVARPQGRPGAYNRGRGPRTLALQDARWNKPECSERVTGTPSSIAATPPRRLPAGRSQRSFAPCAPWPALPRSLPNGRFGSVSDPIGCFSMRFYWSGPPRVKTLLTMLRFNRLVNRFGGPTDASELILV